MSIKEKLLGLFKPIDLTTGSIYKKIIIFTLPILLSLLFQQVYTISDAAIVGHYLSAEEVSGVNVVYSLIFIVLQFAFGCTSGFSVISSNKKGENDLEGIRKSFACQFLLSLIISIILTIIAIACMPYLLNFIGINESSGDYKYAYTYLLIIYIGLFTQIFYNLMVSVLRSIGDSLAPLLFLIGSTLINILLDLLFIICFKWGVAGAAWATVIAQFISFIGCFIYAYIKYDYLRMKWKDFKLSFKFIGDHLRSGLPLAFQFSILAIGLIILQKGMIKFDAVNGVFDCKNGYGAAIKFNDFLMCPLSSLGTAMLSFSGQNYGARNEERIRKGIKASIVIMLISYVILFALAGLFSINGAFTNLFLSGDNNNERVKFYASTYVLIDTGLYFILGFLFIGRNVLQGLGKPLFPFLAGIGEMVARILIVEFMPRLIDSSNPTSDNAYIGICFSDPLAWVFACIFLFIGIYIYIIKGKLFKDFKKDEIEEKMD